MKVIVQAKFSQIHTLIFMIVVAVFFFSFLLCFHDRLLLFVLLFLFLQNIFVRVPILMDHPHSAHSTHIWHTDETVVVTVPFQKKHLLNDFFDLLYLTL